MDRAGIAWVLALAGPLALDAWLLRRGHLTLSAHARHHPYLTTSAVAFFVGHLTGHPRWLRPVDPLHVAGRLLAPR